jgi:hypothetical protein
MGGVRQPEVLGFGARAVGKRAPRPGAHRRLRLDAKLVFGAWLVGRYGVSGLMLATALMYTTTVLLAWMALVRRRRST